MAGLAILKHTYDLSDEVLCERWVENPYHQFFQRMGEEKLQVLLQESLSVATKTEAIKQAQSRHRHTTVQPKNVMFPTDVRLLNRAREILVRLAKRRGLALRQSYARVASST
ncbi:transposase [Bradyrhizobium brasilense]|nr:transposase [Bradyrhizobium brasilense]